MRFQHQTDMDYHNSDGYPLSRREYAAPRIMSAENLETTAATCDGTGGYGKDGNINCNPEYPAGS